ncbi:hypothetical protein ACFRSX_23805 [Streptomyces goshikiensis]|uniref:hypothetical protein n=1 Tax=Streptomyces TaxID=1883 RepID=UPI000C26FB1F|nr:hypothetical protein [Streptomyces sp. CB02120-2]PJN18902.1 hypothetical protein CG724_08805 [Streptomyces sp. CB02120-2]
MTTATNRDQALADAAAATASTTTAQEQAAPTLRELALEEAALDLLAVRVAAARKDVRARMQTALDGAARRDGVERVVATLPNGETVATISLRAGATGPVVVDEEQLARWLRQTYPAQDWTTTRIVREVRPWKLAELVAQMDAAGATQIVDPDTGEVHDVPGVLIKPVRARTHALTWRKTGKAAVGEAWRSGTLTGYMAAITAAPEESTP